MYFVRNLESLIISVDWLPEIVNRPKKHKEHGLGKVSSSHRDII